MIYEVMISKEKETSKLQLLINLGLLAHQKFLIPTISAGYPNTVNREVVNWS